MEENSKSNDMSDKDRKMAESYEYKHVDDETEDSDKSEKKESNESDSTEEKKTPKRSLFFESEENDADKNDKDKVKEKGNLFSGLLKNDVETDESDEVHEDFAELVIEHQQAVDNELTQAPPEDEAAVQANANFLENVEDRLEEGMEPEEAIDDAMEDEIVPPQADATEADLSNQALFEPEEEEETQLTTTASTTPTPPSPPPSRPTSPRPLVSPPPPPPPTPPLSPNFNQPQNPNIIPNTQANQQPNLNVAPTPPPASEAEPDKHRRAKDRLAGGLIGYMIGRRGGRKRTEARLQPEIDRRDEALKDLEGKLTQSEEAVRKMTAEKAEQTAAVEKVEKKVEQVETQTIKQEVKIVEKQERAFEQQLEAQAEKSAHETSPELAEAGGTFSASGPEQVGAMMERLVPQSARQETVGEKSIPAVEKDPRTMSMPELLEVASHIRLENTNVRELYEHKRIDAINLRRVVIEYLEGGNHYEKILHKSLEAVEMQRELRGEIRTDDTGVFRPIAAGSSYAASQYTTGAPSANYDSAPTTLQQLEAHESGLLEQSQQLLVSNQTAVVAGVIAGVIIMIFLFLIF